MNTATTLLDSLVKQGVELRAEGEKLLFRPSERVTEGVKAKLREHKPEILAWLQSCSTLADLYRRYWETPETEPMATFVSLHREIGIVERQVGEETALQTFQAAARRWYEQNGACPSCGKPGVLHCNREGDDAPL